MSFRPRRSALYLPASNAKALEKARTLPCDVVILDLEDAVAPEAKAIAREAAIAAARDGGFGARELVARVNGIDSEWGRDDLAALAGSGFDAILVPKVSSAEDIRSYERHLGGSSTPLWAMIETARSIGRLDEIASMGAEGRLACFVMGTNDLAKEMRARLDVARTPFLGMLALSVAAARAYGLSILDGVYNALDDDAGLASQCRQAVEYGFDGKTLIHPRQIEICNAAFIPDAAAVAWARRILAAFDEPENQGKGAIRVDGRMVERLHLVEAERTLAMAASDHGLIP